MKHRLINPLRLSLLTAAGLWILTSCSDNSITGPPGFPLLTQAPGTPLKQGIPADQMKWVSWKPEIVEKLRMAAKSGTQSKSIDEDGGKIGGKKSLGNKVIIPEDALNEDYLEYTFGDEEVRISVVVNCVDKRTQCGAGVDFLPSMQFDKPVKVVLSWEFVDYQGGDLNFSAYYSQDSGANWFEVEVAEINYEKKTLTLYVDHFTRFAWSL